MFGSTETETDLAEYNLFDHGEFFFILLVFCYNELLKKVSFDLRPGGQTLLSLKCLRDRKPLKCKTSGELVLHICKKCEAQVLSLSPKNETRVFTQFL